MKGRNSLVHAHIHADTVQLLSWNIGHAAHHVIKERHLLCRGCIGQGEKACSQQECMRSAFHCTTTIPMMKIVF